MANENEMKIVEWTEPRPEKHCNFRALPLDYPAVISQIKREVLIEISSYPGNGVFSEQKSRFDLLPDNEVERLLSRVTSEAQQRGLLQPDYCEDGLGITQTMLAIVFFPQARQKLIGILQQSARNGLELVKQANSLLEQTKRSILTIIGNELR